MDIETRHKIMRIARNVRRQAERREPSGSNLAGLCASASITLRSALRREGIRARLVGNEGHAFLVYKRHIIDVTATQFGDFPKVVLWPVTKCNDYWHWNADRCADWFNWEIGIEDMPTLKEW